MVCPLQVNIETYGIDYDELMLIQHDDEDDVTVDVPESTVLCNILGNDGYRQLSLRVNPLDISEFCGVDLYLETMAFLAEVGLYTPTQSIE